MTVTYDLIIRNARDMDGTPITVGIVDGRIAALGPAVDGRGAAVAVMLAPPRFH